MHVGLHPSQALECHRLVQYRLFCDDYHVLLLCFEGYSLHERSDGQDKRNHQQRDRFEAGQKIDIIGTSKGRGFQGVVKRYGFAGGPASHGSMFHRRGGSYGMCQWPGHVIKGKKMPGHMGDVQRTVQNLKVVKVIADKNLILIKGSVPGNKGSLVTVRTAVKQKRAHA